MSSSPRFSRLREWVKGRRIIGRSAITLYESIMRVRKIYAPRYLLLCYHSCAVRIRRKRGTTTEQIRSRPLIVSLTTIPSRLHRTALAVSTLLEQTLLPDRLILWVSDELGADDLPSVLSKLQARGLEIRFTPDVGPHTKLLPALQAYPDSVIITVDDDTFYRRDCIEQLYRAYEAEPEFIHCHSADLILCQDGQVLPSNDWSIRSPDVRGPSRRLFPLGIGGVLYPPDVFHPDVHNITLLKQLSPHNDDIWFRAMTLQTGTLVKKTTASGDTDRPTIPDTQRVALNYLNLSGENDRQIAAMLAHYGNSFFGV